MTTRVRPVCLSTRAFFPPNKQLFHYFYIFVRIHFCKAVPARVVSLATGLVARIHSFHCRSLTSISSQQLKTCFKSLQAEATRDQFHSAKLVCMLAKSFSPLWLFATRWTIARQAPLSLGFSRQKYWSGLPCPPPGDLPNSGIKPTSFMLPIMADRLLSFF